MSPQITTTVGCHSLACMCPTRTENPKHRDPMIHGVYYDTGYSQKLLMFPNPNGYTHKRFRQNPYSILWTLQNAWELCFGYPASRPSCEWLSSIYHQPSILKIPKNQLNLPTGLSILHTNEQTNATDSITLHICRPLQEVEVAMYGTRPKKSNNPRLVT